MVRFVPSSTPRVSVCARALLLRNSLGRGYLRFVARSTSSQRRICDQVHAEGCRVVRLFVAVVAQAQTLPTFRQIVVIFQENRTPDNLFGSAPSGGTTCGSEDPFDPGVDVRNGGPDETQND